MSGDIDARTASTLPSAKAEYILETAEVFASPDLQIQWLLQA